MVRIELLQHSKSTSKKSLVAQSPCANYSELNESTVVAAVPIPETTTERKQKTASRSGHLRVPLGNVFEDRSDWLDFDRFELKHRLGAGAMGAVYLAYDEVLERNVAIKRLHPALRQDTASVARFYDEAMLLGQIWHPNVVAFHGVGTPQRLPNFEMEYVEGESLGAIVAKGPLDWQFATQLCIQVCQGLIAVHSKQCVHGDIKPGNLMLSASGQIKIIDFGLSKRVGSLSLTTTPGIVAGTPAYMSPEQCRGKALDERSDIYALGATYFTLLTGVTPYANSETINELMSAQCHEEPPCPNAIDPKLPDDAVYLVQKAMAKDPDQRFQSADEFEHALKSILKGASESMTVVSPLKTIASGRTSGRTPPIWHQFAFAGCVGTVLLGFDILNHVKAPPAIRRTANGISNRDSDSVRKSSGTAVADNRLGTSPGFSKSSTKK